MQTDTRISGYDRLRAVLLRNLESIPNRVKKASLPRREGRLAIQHPDYSMGKVSFLSQGSSKLKYQGLPGIALAPPGTLVSPFTPAASIRAT